MNAEYPRVVFVDDDAAIRRLVASVLGDMPLELVCCASVAEARAALGERAARLVITDLMLPGETGFDLLEALAADPALRAGAHLVVFSAGLNAETRARLTGLDVWRELAKPVSLQALETCVVEALALALSPASEPARSAAPAAAIRTAAEAGGLRENEVHAIATGFGGDAALYLSFRTQVHAQWRHDLDDADRAAAQRDWPALHRLAHSLKGVLLLLGDESGAALARKLEAASAGADGDSCRQQWHCLKIHLAGQLVRQIRYM